MNIELLRAVYGIDAQRAAAWLPYMREALAFASITTMQRKACWLAQIGHESGCLRYTKELWGPTSQQRRYDPVTTLSGRLGNIHPGDGERYMGRGLIQTTGRANYALTTVMLRQLLGTNDVPDFEARPELLQLTRWAALSAALFWRVKDLNRWADSLDFQELTRRINGGYNGLAHRQALYTRAIIAL